eukprot:Gregarina_sp_Pseudo_9__5211@NODE_576_length_2557_cov_46_313344_g545_i0_p2_GENE_NODE_576_length_2557_cov_46_313344_g545_i0NODE_576_length_2557_cov_46_313344_g545_i0_p2_ORF_typecomplete_len215_score30_40DUF846/PF05832_12/1_2e38DUF4282/PF14110_6/34DUF4282/PF14110_6/0_69DUF21/PF01595_20/0_89DUF21/PF01595_20/31ThrE/PF06738_12/15ThrE/PF06738_12/5_1DUF4133/PF13571_6/3_2DUF4133/PF13571_6/63_NODE_576_length_2557_cov_46_313344_g545_i019122526
MQQPSFGPAPLASTGSPPTAAVVAPFLQTAKHPTICALHIITKLLALFFFCFGSFLFGGFTGDYVFTFVVTTLALAVDFWITKNVCGRKLVGMLWTTEVLEDGSSEFKYHRSTDEQMVNRTDKIVFWTALCLWPVLWGISAFFYLIQLRLDWVLLTMIGCLLGGANLVGFWRCSKESKRKIQEFASSALFKTLVSRATSLLTAG